MISGVTFTSTVVNAEGVSMEELDALQLELELLLSSVLVRQNAVNNQLSIIYQLEKGKYVPKPVSFVNVVSFVVFSCCWITVCQFGFSLVFLLHEL